MLVDCLGFYQGDDATGIFEVMYPSGKSGGDRKTLRQALRHVLEMTGDDRETVIRELETYGASGVMQTKDHVMVWNYAYNWVALYRRVTKKEAKERQLVTA